MESLPKPRTGLTDTIDDIIIERTLDKYAPVVLVIPYELGPWLSQGA